jgi:hypothetical protein
MTTPRLFAQKAVQVLKRPSRVGAGLVLVIASLLVYAYFPLPVRAESSPCQTASTKTVKSPNGQWKAVTTEVYCENGYSFLANATYTVALVHVPNPSIKHDVFAVDDDGTVTRPKISWNGNTTLQINTIHPYGTNLQLTSFNRVHISYSYR